MTDTTSQQGSLASGGIPADSLVSDWLEMGLLPTTASDHTIRSYRSDVGGFVDFMTTYHGERATLDLIGGIDRRTMRSWMASEREKGVSARSLARKLSAVRGFYRWLNHQHRIDTMIVETSKSPRYNSKHPRPAGVKDCRDMLEHLDDAGNWIAARNVALFLLMYGCGLRVSEALSLHMGDTPLSDTVRIIGKGGKERIVPVISEARKGVDRYVSLCPQSLGRDDALFRGKRGAPLGSRAVRKVIEEARLALGLPGTTTPHALRHSFATHILNAGGDIRIIQELLGHKSISSTEKYTLVEPSKLLETYRKSHPFAE